MASSTSYNTAGNREQILDIITVLEPESTPLVSMMKKGNATSTFVEWQADKLATPDFSGVGEGEDVSSFKNQAEDRARLGNYVQKFRDTFQVSDIHVPHKTVRPKPEVARLTKLAACSSGSDRVVNLPIFLPLTKALQTTPPEPKPKRPSTAFFKNSTKPTECLVANLP